MWVNIIQFKYARVMAYVECHHSIGKNFRDQLMVERVEENIQEGVPPTN